jgi:hypothetical protein
VNHEDKLLKFIEENSQIESVGIKIPIILAMINVIACARINTSNPGRFELYDLEEALDEYDNILEGYLTL